MYKQSRNTIFGRVSARTTPSYLPENYSGNAFRRENTQSLDERTGDFTDGEHIPASSEQHDSYTGQLLLPAALPAQEMKETAAGPLSALGNILSGDGGLLLLVLLVLAAGGGKHDDGALLMILILLCL